MVSNNWRQSRTQRIGALNRIAARLQKIISDQRHLGRNHYLNDQMVKQLRLARDDVRNVANLLKAREAPTDPRKVTGKFYGAGL